MKLRELQEKAEHLREQGEEAEQQVEYAENSVRSARAHLQSAQSALDAAQETDEDGNPKGDVASARAAVSAAQAMLQAAESDLRRAEGERDRINEQKEETISEFDEYTDEEAQNLDVLQRLQGMRHGGNAEAFVADLVSRMNAGQQSKGMLEESLGRASTARYYRPGGSSSRESFVSSLFGPRSPGGSGGYGASSGSASGSGQGPFGRTPQARAQNSAWQATLKNVDETIGTYHAEMTARGAYDGAMLQRFLAEQKKQMLQYESSVLEANAGNRPPLSDSEIYHYVTVGENSTYNYEYLANQFSEFCMKDIRSWVGQINPNPKNDPRRRVNCGKCAEAVYQRLNGNMKATASLGTYSIPQMNALTGRTQTTMTPAQIESYLRQQGAGSHVVVGVDRAAGSGHWFNAFYDGRNVYTIEGQGGAVNGWPPDYGNVVHWDASI